MTNLNDNDLGTVRKIAAKCADRVIESARYLTSTMLASDVGNPLIERLRGENAIEARVTLIDALLGHLGLGPLPQNGKAAAILKRDRQVGQMSRAVNSRSEVAKAAE